MTQQDRQQEVSKGLQDFIFQAKYARWLEDKKRRETWEEATNRIMKMHLDKFNYLEEENKERIRWAFDLVRQKRVLPSMRAMQFGGPAVLAHNARIFNCSVRHIDGIRAFAEVAYLMLCGCGTGIGLHSDFLARLPNLVDSTDKTGTVVTYVIEDNIEGWADSLEALLACYFKNTCYSGRKIIFDYSKIRRKGARLKIGGGKAPGYKPLKNALTRIKNLLDHLIEGNGQYRLESINAYDILMHFADAVLSGGSRRTASSVVFEATDDKMIESKTTYKVKKVTYVIDEESNIADCKIWINHPSLNQKTYNLSFNLNEDKWTFDNLVNNKEISWLKLEPQRARSNNSVLLIRGKFTKEELQSIFDRTRQFGEPGFVFANHEHTLYNPCFTASQRVLTDDGWVSFEELIGQNPTIIQDNRIKGFLNKNGKEEWVLTGENGISKNTATKVCQTGTNIDVFELELYSGRKVTATKNHHFATKNGMVELQNLSVGDSIMVGVNDVFEADFDNAEWKIGFLTGLFYGDGCLGKDSSINIDLWDNEDLVLIENTISSLLNKDKKFIETEYEQGKKRWRLSSADLYRLFEQNTSTNKKDCSWLFRKSKNTKAGFISGLFYADGHIDYNSKSKSISIRITQSNENFLRDIMLIMQELGSFAKIHKLLPSRMVKFKDNQKEYLCKESFRLIIGNRQNCINTTAWLRLFGNKHKNYSNIINNSKRTNNKINFYDKVKSIKYVGKEDVYCLEENFNRTLIVEGMTARRCFEIGFIPITSDGRCGVQFCNLTSINGTSIKSIEDFLECIEAQTIIGTLQATYTNFPYLSPAAKQLTEEEALLGNSITGIMDSPSILLNDEALLQGAEFAVEVNSKWAKILGIKPAARTNAIKPEGTGSLAIGSAPGAHAHHAEQFFRRIQTPKDENVYLFFKQKNPHMCEESVWNTNTKEDVITFPIKAPDGAIVKENLDAISHLNIIKKLQSNWVLAGQTNNKKDVSHNVSCTVIVKDDEWDAVVDYLYENKDYFSAVSFIGYYGDKIYKQAPYEKVSSKEDLDYYNMLVDNYTPVDFTQLVENQDETNLTAEASCAGGACLN